MSIGKSSGTAVLSEDVEFKGSIYFTNKLELHGRFEGEIISDGPLIIGESAVIKAEIKSNSSITIRGKVQGNIDAKEKVDVTGSAVLLGDVKSPKFSLAETATFVGKTETGSGRSQAADFANIFQSLDKPKKSDDLHG